MRVEEKDVNYYDQIRDYGIPRLKLSVLKGYHTIEPNPYTNKTILDAPREDTVFSITTRPKDMKTLAESIIEICETEENMQS